MNIGYEDEELKPFVEPEPDNNDMARIGKQTTQPTPHMVDVVDMLPLLTWLSSVFYVKLRAVIIVHNNALLSKCWHKEILKH